MKDEDRISSNDFKFWEAINQQSLDWMEEEAQLQNEINRLLILIDIEISKSKAMKTGVELIKDERIHQINKYGFTGEHHANHPEWYDKGQLITASKQLSSQEISHYFIPENWDKEWFNRLCQKPYKERLVIAGTLIASEIDRLNVLENKEK